MALAIVHSRALSGMHAPEVAVEVHLANGLPSFTVVGLPDTEVKESRERVRAAIQVAGFEFPARRITVNLAPADLPKESGRFDLPIAVGILAASGQVSAARLAEHEFAGELALSGELRPVRGALAMAWHACRAGRAFVLPSANAAEAARVAQARVLPAASLTSVCAHLNGLSPLVAQPATPVEVQDDYPDLLDVKGQAGARHALEVAAAGAHHLLMVGPPGTGKSMLAARLPGILPAMSEAEALEAASLHALSESGGRLPWRHRPYRAPHHSASAVALVGGGSEPKPGEISLAHHGVLFLDELPEFDRKVLEVLREPLESGVIHISRAARQASFPARFQLLAAMNPCPCGFLGHPSGRCRCSPEQLRRYRGRISGPLLDRIDLIVEVPSLAPADLRQGEPGEASALVRRRVEAARERQLARQGKPNALLSGRELEELDLADEDALATLSRASERLGLSARSFHRVWRVALTIADLAAADRLGRAQVLQAVQLRRALVEG
ncbi:YifB family Mg chelatase-like AAA ATPase [Crenobacter luteus]|uniref:ATP-dependent protease n=1 Tax=Crenobacter luteus TaxID=1452487 RepID=A0A165FDU9_9NEIS|nr:YifB family Mg chelatase-like AAA ATPase [Crenobacter luteus]KZE32939.1 ATP-dependent protease [Crenobacter luteus]